MKKRKWLIVIGVLLVLGIIGSLVGDPEPATTDLDTDGKPAPVSQTPQQNKKPEPISVSMKLSSGHYVSGTDFPPGKYDIVAVKGGGNVMSSNMYRGGINAIMGTKEMNQQGLDIYEQEYHNIDLPKGVTLSISGVTVELTCDKASGEPLTPRKQQITETVTLKNGHFVAGDDFPAGIYDIKAVAGGGNVMSDNMMNGGINAILGTADMNDLIDMYELEYKNISLPSGTTLSVDGVTITLTPSK